MNIKWWHLVLVIFLLAACSGPAQQDDIAPDADRDVELSKPATATPEVVPDADISDAESDATASANKAIAEEWHLVASYQWIGSVTPTDMLYTWEAWFTVAPDGTLVALDQIGWAEGQAGISWTGGCVEAQPATADWNYTFSGSATSMDQETVEQIYGEVSEAIVDQGKVKMFVFNFAKPDIFEYTLPPFTCAPDMDEEWRKSLLTYWVTTIPVMMPAFRTVPAEAGMFCGEVLSFEEEGLGTLVPCYLLEKE